MASAKSITTRGINSVLRYVGIGRGAPEPGHERPCFPDAEPWVSRIISEVRAFTMTSDERLSALCHAMRYVARHGIPGDIVECGVWRGGSMMAAAMTLLAERDESRTLYLCDTFEGMTEPSEFDRATLSGKTALSLLEKADRSANVWAYAPLDDVRTNLGKTGYPRDHVLFIRGKVEDTIPAQAPHTIALLRLDTDWYESTRHELIHLYPRLSIGGVLIIDDYGHWEGARKAVDEYIKDNRLKVLLQRIDYTGRIAVKVE
jgi:O-methyltransferase